MRRLLPLLFVLSACSTAEAPPDDLLDRAKFKQVLLGAQLVEARLNQEMVIEHRTDNPVEVYYTELFNKEGITREQFERTYRFYTEHPVEMKVIYEELIVELDSLKERVVDQPVVPK